MQAVTISEDQESRYARYQAFAHDKYYLVKVFSILSEKFAADSQNKKLLEIGCADGSFSEKLVRELGFTACGVDISPGAARLARQKGVSAVALDIGSKKLPFREAEFDLVVACEVIEHVFDTDFVISEAFRVLKKGGVLVLTTPNLASLVNRVKLLLGLYPSFVPEYRRGGAGHIRAYTLPVLLSQLRSHRFFIVKATSPNATFPMASPHVPGFLKQLAMRLGDFVPSFGSHLIVVARK